MNEIPFLLFFQNKRHKEKASIVGKKNQKNHIKWTTKSIGILKTHLLHQIDANTFSKLQLMGCRRMQVMQ